MADRSHSGGGRKPSSGKDPFPIVVPKGDKTPGGDKAPAGDRVPRWIRDFIPSSESTADKPDPETTRKPQTKKQPPPAPVQRATTQLLPGRLHPVDPTVLNQEIRFLRTPEAEQVVTLGWNIGEPPDHITLNHSSIEPLHAKMTYREGAWWMENMAEYEPVMVNGVHLRPSAPPQMLKDGDEIRIGAVVFRFHFP